MAIGNYRSVLRSAVRGLWSGAIDVAQFDENMRMAESRYLTEAFAVGFKEGGINPNEITIEEQTRIGEFIQRDSTFITGFGDAILQNSRANGGKLTPLFQRVELWVERYIEAKALGKAMALADQKAEFVLGPTKDHCRSCTGLNGRVYRYSVWIANNAVPPHNWNFECRGGCQCSLVPTDRPITKGKFPVSLLASGKSFEIDITTDLTDHSYYEVYQHFQLMRDISGKV